MQISLFLNQKVPNQIAFAVVLLAGLLVAWITINAGGKIISDFSEIESHNGAEIEIGEKHEGILGGKLNQH